MYIYVMCAYVSGARVFVCGMWRREQRATGKEKLLIFKSLQDDIINPD